MELRDKDTALEALVLGDVEADDPALAAWWDDADFRAEAEAMLSLQATLDEDGAAYAEAAEFDPREVTPGAAALAASLAAGERAPSARTARRRPAWVGWARGLAAALLFVFALTKLGGDEPGPGPLMGDTLEITADPAWTAGDPIAWTYVDGFVGEFLVEILDGDGATVDDEPRLLASPFTPTAERAGGWPKPFGVRVTVLDANGELVTAEETWFATDGSD